MELEDFVEVREDMIHMFGNDELLRQRIHPDMHYYANKWEVSLLEVLLLSYICSNTSKSRAFWESLFNKYSNTGKVPQIVHCLNI